MLESKKKKLITIASAFIFTIQNAFISFSDASIADEKFKSMSAEGAPSLILGTVIWILRIVGVVVFIVGIYKLTVAKKNGEAEDMNMAMIKVVIGACFLCFPAILKALGIIS